MINNHKTPLLENTLFLSVAINAVLFLLFFAFINPRFQVNDDVSLMMISSGFYTGYPNEYLIYTNVIIGKFLKFMYDIAPGFNWYTTYLYLTHFISMTLLLYSILYQKSGILRILLFLLLFAFLELSILVNLQFTPTAFVSAQSGLFLSIAFLDNKEKSSWLAIFTGAFLMTFGGLIREKVLYLTLLLSMPLIALKFWETKSVKLIALLVITLTLFFACHQYDKGYYAAHKEWQQYLEYNGIRDQLHDNPRTVYNETTKPVFDRAKWSQNDFNMFKTLFFEDKEIYSKENLETILSSFSFIYEKGIYDTLKGLFYALYNFKLLVLSSFCLTIALVPFIPPVYKKYIYATVSISIAVIIYLFYSMKLPLRVLMPILFFPATVSVFFASQKFNKFDKKPLLRKYIKIFVAIILISLFIFNFLDLRRISKTNQANYAVFYKMVKTMSPDKNKLFVIWDGSLPVENISPYSNLREYEGFNIYWLGAETKSPLNYQVLERFSINNLYTSLYEKDNIFLICRPEGYKELLQRYIKEHYNQHIEFELISNFGNVLPPNSVGYVYKVRKV